MRKVKQSFFQKYKLSITVIALVLVTLCSFVICIDATYQNASIRNDLRTEIINVKFEQSAQRIDGKISNYKNTHIKNIEVAAETLMIYSMAYRLAKEKNGDSIVFEKWADSITEVYLDGFKDGKKHYDGGV